MITYGMWKTIIKGLNMYSDNFEIMSNYCLCVFLSMFTIWFDIILSPFEIIGILIFIISKIWRK